MKFNSRIPRNLFFVFFALLAYAFCRLILPADTWVPEAAQKNPAIRLQAQSLALNFLKEEKFEVLVHRNINNIISLMDEIRKLDPKRIDGDNEEVLPFSMCPEFLRNPEAHHFEHDLDFTLKTAVESQCRLLLYLDLLRRLHEPGLARERLARIIRGEDGIAMPPSVLAEQQKIKKANKADLDSLRALKHSDVPEERYLEVLRGL